MRETKSHIQNSTNILLRQCDLLANLIRAISNFDVECEFHFGF